MKTKRFFQLSLAVAATAMLAACSNGGDGKTPTTPTADGTISNTKVDRTEVTITQPITITADYTPSKEAVPTETKAQYAIYNNGAKANVPSEIGGGFGKNNVDFTFKNNKLNLSILSLHPGNYKVYLYVLENINKTTVGLKDSVSFTVTEKHPDICNSYWKDSKELTEKNLRFFLTSEINRSKEDMLSFSEKNGYYVRWEADISKLNLTGDRMTYYKFQNNQLNQVQYVVLSNLDDKTPFDKSIVHVFIKHITYLQKAYYTLVPEKYFEKVPEGQTLTAEEKALVDEFKKGLPYEKGKNYDENKILEKAIKEGRLSLNVLGKNAAGTTSIFARITKSDDKILINVVFADAASLK